MLFKQRFFEGIREGRITLAFRRWRRPTVRSGGTLLTPAGRLDIASVTAVSVDAISRAEARRAGYDTLDELRADLDARPEGDVYRIELGALRPDPRRALREKASLSADERSELLVRLKRMDDRSATGPWTLEVLALIDAHPGLRAADLCCKHGQDKLPFKQNVRKLKTLGLTESLEVGYRLSPRGHALLEHARSRPEGRRT